MVRENRIKDYVFDSISVNGSVIVSSYSHVINGEILKIRFENITSPGSLWLAESGTNIAFFRKNDFASGNATFEVYPFVYAVNNTNTTGSPQSFMNYVVNGPIYFAGSGFTSGTAKTFGPVTVFYR